MLAVVLDVVSKQMICCEQALTRSTKEPLLACTGTLDKVTFDVGQDGRGLGSLEAISSVARSSKDTMMPVGEMGRQWGVREIEAKYTSQVQGR